jgi:hypothetical protein
VLFAGLNAWMVRNAPSKKKPKKKRMSDGFVMFLGGGLGAGKTLFAMKYAYDFLKRYKAKRLVYTNFSSEISIRFTINDEWPEALGALVIIDELLLLIAYNALPQDWLANGLTMARHRGQQVLLISQGHRPPFDKKFWGTIGRFMLIKGLNTPWGRICWVRESAEPLVRNFGYRSPGMRTFWRWIPWSIAERYDTRDLAYVPSDLKKRQSKVTVEMPPKKRGRYTTN